MQTNLIRVLTAAFLLLLAVGAAGIPGCSDRPAGNGATAPSGAMKQQEGPRVDDEAYPPADRKTQEKDRGPSPKLLPGFPAKVGWVLTYIDEHKRAPRK